MITEVQPFQYTILDESKKKPGVLMTLEGVFQRADTKNANGRVYPRSLWDKLMKDESLKERLENRRMLGELDHPASGSTSGHRVSHVITDHKLLPNGEVKGRLDILDTPAGRIAETMFRAGVGLGISSRGDGSVERKGDVSEIQDDFRLETYDLVLKPSTPGAYPRIVESEEKARENIDLIANAVEGLVNTTGDVEVLLECHKIISVLEGCDSRCQSILEGIKSKLDSKYPRQTNEDTKENVMQAGNGNITGSVNPPSPQLSPEIASFLKEQVDRGIAEAVKEKDDKIAELNDKVVALATEKEDLSKKLGAATELIEEFQRKVEDLTESATESSDLQKRYDAAVKIIDEAVGRLQHLGDTERRLEAAMKLLSTSIDKHKEEAVNAAVNDVLADVNEAVAEKLRPMLESASTAQEVRDTYEQLSSLVESMTPAAPVNKEPLPVTNKQLNENDSSRPSQSKSSNNFVVNHLLNRVGGSVG